MIVKWPHTLFKEIQNIKDRKKRVAYLKEHGNNFFTLTLLQMMWNENVKLDLPLGKPPFHSPDLVAADEMAEITDQELKEILLPIGQCVVGNSAVKRVKKEMTYIKILESMPHDSALIFVAAKDGNILTMKSKKYSKITKPLVQEAFPEIFPAS
jgi:hypothetical protein